MNRKIVFLTCEDCPHFDHKGAFGKIAYVPVCRKKKKELPYAKAVEGERVMASATYVIPDWCPLPVDKERK